jgi:WD40 repeat protein
MKTLRFTSTFLLFVFLTACVAPTPLVTPSASSILPPITPTTSINPLVITPSNVTLIKELTHLGSGKANKAVQSPDKTKLAIASSIGVYLYEVKPLRLLWLTKTEEEMQAIAFSPDGKSLASTSTYFYGQTNSIIFWDASNGKSIGSILTKQHISDIAFSPTENTFATGGDDGINIWSLSTKNLSLNLQMRDNSMRRKPLDE